MRRFGLVLGICACAWGLGWLLSGSQAGPTGASLWAQESAPTRPTASSTAATSPAAATTGPTAGALWASGVDLVERGQFQAAAADLRRAAAEAPQEKRLPAAARLLEDYLGVYKKWDQERQKEFEAAGDRVRRCLLAQSHLEALAAAKIDKVLRDRVSEMDAQMARVATSEWVAQASLQQVREMKPRAAEASLKMLAALEGAMKALPDDASAYGKTFGELAEKLRQRLADYAKAWESVRTETTKDLRAAGQAIATPEEELGETLSDLEAMVSDQPWRVGLVQARLARTLSPSRDGMNAYAWYRQIVQAVTARGEEAMQAGRWYEAMNVYGSLHDLESDNETFRDRATEARRHVRVLSLYGRGFDANAATQPEDAEPRWQEITQGIDADIVHNVIAQLDEQYVSNVDYRKLTRGGLRAIRILAQTPEAANAFEGLSDATKRRQFLEAVDRELDNAEKNDRVDSVYLSMVLNAVLRASERSVDVPLGVLAMEFTDGFLEELDRFSSMVWPSEVDEFNKQTMGQFYGVGIAIAKEANEPLKVVSPLANSPAFRAGIQSGDWILTVDGRRTDTLPVDRLVRMIQGPKGTRVVLGVRSRGQTQVREVPLMRDEIRLSTVKGWRLEPGGEGDNWQYWVDPNDKIAYIRITQFTSETPGALDRALTQLRRDGCRSLVLDLRFNPGGLLDVSKQVVDEFLEGVRRIVVTRGRQKVQREYLSSDGGAFVKGDLVVLVNELSASASEIVSGALQDCRRAIILGQRTYGKGSVQNVLQIPKHPALLKLTTAYYYLPSGRLLHRKEGEKTWGVDPQVEILMTPRQTRHWLAVQRKTDLLQNIDPEDLSADLAEEYHADFQLNTAVLLLRLLQLQEASPSA